MMGPGCSARAYASIASFAEALELDMFPVDRWVRRLLAKHEIPTDQETLIQLSLDHGYEPRLVARAVYLHGSGN